VRAHDAHGRHDPAPVPHPRHARHRGSERRLGLRREHGPVPSWVRSFRTCCSSGRSDSRRRSWSRPRSTSARRWWFGSSTSQRKHPSPRQRSSHAARRSCSSARAASRPWGTRSSGAGSSPTGRCRGP
jgi:hypothetical protein